MNLPFQSSVFFTSLQQDRVDAISSASAIVASTKGESVMVSS